MATVIPPLGWDAVPGSGRSVATEKDRWLVKKQWPFKKNVISFEAWRAATCYEGGQGGELFHKLMQWTQTQVTGPNLKGHHYNKASGHENNPSSTEWIHATSGKPATDRAERWRKGEGEEHNLDAYLPAIAYKTAKAPEYGHVNGSWGYVANAGTPWVQFQRGEVVKYKGTKVGKQGHKVNDTGLNEIRELKGEGGNYVTVKSGLPKPGTVFNFIESCGIERWCTPGGQGQKDNARGMGAADNATRTFAGKKPEKKLINPDETTDCAYLGTQMAAFWGLYYYKGCEDKRYNHVVDGVAMRLPNPSYALDKNKLVVKEPLNEEWANWVLEGKDETPKYKEGAAPYVGGKKGFYLWGVKTLTHWDLLVSTIERELDPKSNVIDRDTGKRVTALRTVECLSGPWCGTTFRMQQATKDVTKKEDHEYVYRYEDGDEVTDYLSQNKQFNGVFMASGSGNGDEFYEHGLDQDWRRTGNGTANSVPQNLDEWHRACKEHKHEERIHKREDFNKPQTGGLCFGWRIPTALLTWPHTDVPRQRPTYQRFPSRRSKREYGKTSDPLVQGGFDGIAMKEIDGVWGVNKRFKPMIHFLERPPYYTKRVRWAVGDDKRAVRAGDGPHVWGALNDYKKPVHDDEEPDDEDQDDDEPDDEEPDDEDQDPEDPDEDPEDPDEDPEDSEDPDVNPSEQLVPPTMDKNFDPPVREDGEQLQREPMDTSTDEYVRMEDQLAVARVLLDELEESEKPTIEERPVNEKDAKAWDAKQIAKVVKSTIEHALCPANELDGSTCKFNRHFYSHIQSPWPPSDLYKHSRVEYKVEPLGHKGVQDELEKYGNHANMLLRTSAASKLTGEVLSVFGDFETVEGYYSRHGKPPNSRQFRSDVTLFELRLDEYLYDTQLPDNVKQVMREHMARILAIVMAVKHQVDKLRETNMASWPQIFNKEGLKWAAEQTTGPFSKKILKDNEWLQSKQVVWLKKAVSALPKKRIINPKMRVGVWVTTPYHYAFLPLVRQQSLFESNESFSRGCKHCSRAFHEMESMYAPFDVLRDAFSVSAWPQMYWFDSESRPPRGQIYAPQPFHTTHFWTPEPVASHLKKQTGVDGNGEEVEVEGFHNWEVHGLLFGWEWRGGALVKGTDGPLHDEWMKRYHKNPPLKNLYDSKKKPWHEFTFRKYANHVHQMSQATTEAITGRCADDLCVLLKEGGAQGRYSPNAKVKHGMLHYKLMREAKYSNLCVDCAGRLARNNLLTRVGYQRQPGGAAKPTRGKYPNMLGQHTWWNRLLEEARRREEQYGDHIEFFQDMEVAEKQGVKIVIEDKTKKRLPGFLYFDEEEYDDGMAAAQRLYMDMGFCSAMPTEGTKYKTKVLRPPTVFIQKGYDPKSHANVDDSEAVRWAKEKVEILLEWLNSGFKDHTKEKSLMQYLGENNSDIEFDRTKTVALRDELDALGYGLAFKGLTSQDYRMPQFDLEVFRKEWRGKKKLTVMMFDPTRKNSQYEKRVFTEADGWHGDNYWVQQEAEPQMRELTQSSFMITYSLHRRLADPMEARAVLERMADGVRRLFGVDEFLCQIIRFGYKLAEDTPGVISKKQWVHIARPNKAEKLFYGDPNDSSYVYDTYSTHVEQVEADVGVEIGPNRHHPHFHAFLKIKHWSYIHIDGQKIKALLEVMYKGIESEVYEDLPPHPFKLIDGAGMPFYTDNENPYIDIRLKPTDDWSARLQGYITKSVFNYDHRKDLEALAFSAQNAHNATPGPT